MEEGEIWEAGGDGVTVVFPDGNSKEFSSLTAGELQREVRERGVKKFIVKRDGELLTPTDFPLTSGKLVVEEHNDNK